MLCVWLHACLTRCCHHLQNERGEFPAVTKESLGGGQPIALGHTPIRLGRPQQSAKIGTSGPSGPASGPSLRGSSCAADVSHAVRGPES